MPVTITVTDPSSMDRAELIHVLDFLAKYAGFTGAAQPPAPETQAQHRTDLPPTPPMPAPQPTPVTPAPPTAEQGAAMDAPQAPGIEVDSAGMPWDGRIHSATRSRVADGTWRQKRGVEDDVLAQVTAELRQTMAIPASPVQQNFIATTGHADAIPSVPGQRFEAVPVPPSVGSAAPPAPPVSSTPVESAGAAPTASPSSGNQFPKLMQLITGKFTKGELTQASIQAAVAKAGLPSLPMLASRPDLVPVVATELGFAL